MRENPEACEICGAEAVASRQCRRCGCFEWLVDHRGHWNREGLVRGLSPTAALKEAGFPPSTVRRSRRGINRIIRAELTTLGRKYVEIGRDLSPADQEAMVRGRLVENVI